MPPKPQLGHQSTPRWPLRGRTIMSPEAQVTPLARGTPPHHRVLVEAIVSLSATFLSSSGLTVLLPSLGRVLRPHPSTCWSHLDRGHCGFQPRPPTKPEQAPLSLPRKTPSPLSPWSHGLCHHPQQRAGCRITPRNLRPSGEKTFLFLFCHLGTDKLP